jgi:hypothetical protein
MRRLSSGLFSASTCGDGGGRIRHLKLTQRLEAAGLPTGQAQAVAVALAETIGEAVVTREYLDLRLAEQTARIDARFAEVGGRFAEVEGKMAEARAEILKWMFGAVGLQTLGILGGVARTAEADRTLSSVSSHPGGCREMSRRFVAAWHGASRLAPDADGAIRGLHRSLRSARIARRPWRNTLPAQAAGRSYADGIARANHRLDGS